MNVLFFIHLINFISYNDYKRYLLYRIYIVYQIYNNKELHCFPAMQKPTVSNVIGVGQIQTNLLLDL